MWERRHVTRRREGVKRRRRRVERAGNERGDM